MHVTDSRPSTSVKKEVTQSNWSYGSQEVCPVIGTTLLTIFRGMTAIWDEKGNRLPVTILQISRAQVVSVKTQPKHGYWAVQVGIGIREPRNVTKAMLGHFAVAEVAPKAKVGEFRVRDETGLLPLGKFLSKHR